VSAVEETDAAGTAGKDTSGGGQPSGAASTHAGMAVTTVYPHLGYADAVHRELAAWELHPAVVTPGVRTPVPRGSRELVLWLVWPPGHPNLGEDARADGLTLAWSHLTGWCAIVADQDVLLDLDEFAAPAVVAEVALHLAEDGVDCGWTPGEDAARWTHADALADACALFAQRRGR